jgi:Zn-dependent protease with chaperone function
MPLDAFKAILAHEYGHFSNRDTAGGGFALSVRRSLLTFIVGLAQSGHATPWNPAWWFAIGFYKIFLRVSQGASRLQEILADRRAAEAYGGLAFANGLKHVIACDLRFEDHVNAEIGKALKEKLPLQNLWSPPLSGTDPKLLEAALVREPSPYDSHPSPRDRIRWVEKLPAALPSNDDADKDAWSLFHRREHHEREVTLFIYQQLAESGVYPPALPKLGEGTAGAS